MKKQHRSRRNVKHSERFQKANETWSEKAKEAADFFKGKQWSKADLRKLKLKERPPLTINKIEVPHG